MRQGGVITDRIGGNVQMKHALLAAVLVLATGTLVGCSDDGDGDAAADRPTNASQEDFCGTFEDLIAELGKLDADAEASQAVKILKSTGDDLAEVGTPSDMPDDARAGWEYVLDEIDKLDDD